MSLNDSHRKIWQVTITASWARNVWRLEPTQ